MVRATLKTLEVLEAGSTEEYAIQARLEMIRFTELPESERRMASPLPPPTGSTVLIIFLLLSPRPLFVPRRSCSCKSCSPILLLLLSKLTQT